MEYKFEILGQKIVVKNKEEADLAEIAMKIVNQKVDDIKSKCPQWGPQQIAVLALLEVAGEMVKDRKSIDQYREELDKKCSSLMTEIAKVSSNRRHHLEAV
ncbi:MAG: cell division protein ZapA [Bdellovibrionales bacterium]|nr:cell division protein ZapA [Bdellovibrionales bacterium]